MIVPFITLALCFYSSPFQSVEMTTSPTPNFQLDPSALADTVPLRRAGTEEVHFTLLSNHFIGFSLTFKYCVLNPSLPGHGRNHPFPSKPRWCVCKRRSLACRRWASGYCSEQLLIDQGAKALGEFSGWGIVSFRNATMSYPRPTQKTLETLFQSIFTYPRSSKSR